MSFRGIVFWGLTLLIWLLATPTIVSIINDQALSGMEGFVVSLFPWVVLLALLGRVAFEFRGATA